MGLFSNQLSNVVEWEEYRDDIIFWKWCNKEIKKGSRLIIRPGQDAIFMYNGKIEGIFKDDGNYEIESQIIPFLSSLKGFKFGFNSGLRAEVLFVNVKEFTVKWGTKNAINIPYQNAALPGGLPIRAFGTFNMKVKDYVALIDQVAGVKQQYAVDDVKERVVSLLDQLLMKWIVREGKDMFNLQANAFDISEGICSDLNQQLTKTGLALTGFAISSFNYPKEVQDKINKAASYNMVGDVDKYQRLSMADAMGTGGANSSVGQAVGMAAGFNMMNQMLNSNDSNRGNSQSPPPQAPSSEALIKCTACGAGVQSGAKFCNECGAKVVRSESKFCMQCGFKMLPEAKFCPECGAKA